MKSSIVSKVGLAVNISALLAVSIVLVIITVWTNNNAKKTALEEAKLMAERYAEQIDARFEIAMVSARDVAAIFKGKNNFPPEIRRDIFAQILYNAIENNPDFLALWSVWEPNILDGNDAAFINTPNNTDIGRFSPSWYRANGSIQREEANVLEADMAEEDYYTIPKQKMIETILDPYMYSYTGEAKDEMLMTSTIVPVVENGALQYTVGIDFALDIFNNVTDSIKVPGKGYCFIVANNGVFVAHPEKKILGKNIADVDPVYNKKENVVENIKKGTPFYFYKPSTKDGTVSLTYFVPFTIGTSDTPWSFAVSIPVDAMLAETRKATRFLIVLGIIALITIAVITRFAVKLQLRPVGHFVLRAKDLAEGEADLTRTIPIESNDELGELAEWFNKFIVRIHTLIVEVKSSALNVSSAAVEISSSAEELASSSMEQNEQAQSIAAALNELTVTSENIASSIEDTKKITESSTENTQKGGTIIQNTIEGLYAIDKQVTNLSSIIGNLGKSTEKINTIITVIDDIADQTNLLALNAAIEAARAGEAGKGFAVVADEVRKLAEKTAEATKEISAIISGLQHESDKAESSMQDVTKEVKSGVSLGQESLEVLQTIIESGEKVLDSASTVATAITQESATIDDINQKIHTMASASDESSKAVHEVAKTSEELARQSELLKDLVERFKTDEDTGKGLTLK